MKYTIHLKTLDSGSNKQLKYRQILSGLTVLALMLFASVSQAETLPAFSATYTVRYGVLRGEMSLKLQRGESGYVYQTSLRPRGLVGFLRPGLIDESTSFVVSDGQVLPSSYESTDTIASPQRYTQYLFDQRPGLVTGTYKTKTVDEPTRPGGQNRISAHVAVMLALRTQSELTRISVFDRARWRDFDFVVEPAQRVSTPLGDFEAVEVRYTSSKKNKSWSLYCAETLDYVPVMIVYREDGKVKSRAQIRHHERIPAVR
jgi:hypothetical protein